MKTGNRWPAFGIGLSSTILLLALLFNACQGDPVEVPQEDVFTKAKREHLGYLLLNDILASNEFIPKVHPYDTTVYWYVQTLFTQATNVMQLDKQSPSNNRWSGGWEVYIIDNDDLQHAYALPGGNLFITTGMLKNFEREYELYYLLTFEANLMHKSHLLDALKAEYNSLTLINLIEGRATASGVTISDVASRLPNLKFSGQVVRDVDRETVDAICNTSILKPSGILPSLFNPVFQNAKWLQSRPSYSNRPNTIQGFTENNAADCGGNIGSGNYQRYVLNVLN